MAEAVTIAVRVTPRAGRDEIGGAGEDGVLRVRIAAAPVDGAADDALVRLVASALDVPRSAVTILSGARGRHKRLRIDGVVADLIRSRWPGLAVDSPTRR